MEDRALLLGDAAIVGRDELDGSAAALVVETAHGMVTASNPAGVSEVAGGVVAVTTLASSGEGLHIVGGTLVGMEAMEQDGIGATSLESVVGGKGGVSFSPGILVSLVVREGVLVVQIVGLHGLLVVAKARNWRSGGDVGLVGDLGSHHWGLLRSLHTSGERVIRRGVLVDKTSGLVQ